MIIFKVIMLVLVLFGFVYGMVLAVDRTKNEVDRTMGVFSCAICGVFAGVLLMSITLGGSNGSDRSDQSDQPQHTWTITDVQLTDSIQRKSPTTFIHEPIRYIYKYQVNLSDGKMDTVINVNRYNRERNPKEFVGQEVEIIHNEIYQPKRNTK